MAQRTAIGVGIAAVVTVALFWMGTPTPRASAMERLVQNIRQAKSYYVTIDTEMKLPSEPGKTVPGTGTIKRYWRAPGSIRMEQSGNPADRIPKRTEIFPAGKPGIDIRPAQNVYFRKPARRGHRSPLFLLDQLAGYAGQADRDLGTKKINGKTARGFEIDLKKIDPDTVHVPVEIWVDPEMNLPVQIRMAVGGPMEQITTMHDFRWNVDLDPKLFDATPPPGYKDATPVPDSLEQQVEYIRQALSIYAELSGGHYPRVRAIYGDVTSYEMLQMIGIEGAPTAEQLRSAEYAKVQKATEGLGRLHGLFRENPDVTYYGQSVGTKDKIKVLLRWRLEDGRYEVIFGDLRAETVTAERLRELEGE